MSVYPTPCWKNYQAVGAIGFYWNNELKKCNYNQRMVLSLLRRNKSMPKADLARQMGLSPTAVGTIISQLEENGLVLRGEPQRGKVGQPSVPYRIDPAGSFSFGLKIGRRTADLVLLNAEMEVVHFATQKYPYPDTQKILDFAETQSQLMLKQLNKKAAASINGFGIAMPSDIWNWRDEMNMPEGSLESWRRFDPEKQWADIFQCTIFLANDATAACAAELALNSDSDHQNYLYFYIGWFIGGGIVLNGKIFEGSRANAGALGSMPVFDGNNQSQQLIKLASLYTLERELVGRGGPARELWESERNRTTFGAPLDNWLTRASHGISQAIAAAASVIDFEACIIDGAMPSDVRYELLHKVRETYYQTIDLEGLSNIEIASGTVGPNARAIGAGCLPLLDSFSVDLSDIENLSQ